MLCEATHACGLAAAAKVATVIQLLCYRKSQHVPAQCNAWGDGRPRERCERLGKSLPRFPFLSVILQSPSAHRRATGGECPGPHFGKPKKDATTYTFKGKLLWFSTLRSHSLPGWFPWLVSAPNTSELQTKAAQNNTVCLRQWEGLNRPLSGVKYGYGGRKKNHRISLKLTFSTVFVSFLNSPNKKGKIVLLWCYHLLWG